VDPNAYIITFPMLMGGLAIAMATALGFTVRYWITKSDEAAAERKKSLDKSFTDLKDQLRDNAQEVHESFTVVHKRIDEMKAHREGDLKTIADLRVELAKAATKEELSDLRSHIDMRMQELLRAVAGRNN
jgi:uncharacterized coiled-coil DUF342 family protein